jgi:hypothetical protein
MNKQQTPLTETELLSEEILNEVVKNLINWLTTWARVPVTRRLTRNQALKDAAKQLKKDYKARPTMYKWLGPSTLPVGIVAGDQAIDAVEEFFSNESVADNLLDSGYLLEGMLPNLARWLGGIGKTTKGPLTPEKIKSLKAVQNKLDKDAVEWLEKKNAAGWNPDILQDINPTGLKVTTARPFMAGVQIAALNKIADWFGWTTFGDVADRFDTAWDRATADKTPKDYDRKYELPPSDEKPIDFKSKLAYPYQLVEMIADEIKFAIILQETVSNSGRIPDSQLNETGAMRSYIDIINGDDLTEGLLSWVANQFSKRPQKFSAEDFDTILADTDVLKIQTAKEQLSSTLSKLGKDPSLSNEVKVLDDIIQKRIEASRK